MTDEFKPFDKITYIRNLDETGRKTLRSAVMGLIGEFCVGGDWATGDSCLTVGDPYQRLCLRCWHITKWFPVCFEEADENVRLNPDLYENRSHYVRAALIHLNNQHRQERDGGKEAAR